MIVKIHLRNVKGISGSFELGKITNLYGPNGSGKSAILEGLKIALTGYTELGKLANKTFSLSAGKAMEVTIENDQGQTLGRKFEKAGGGAKQVITVNGEVVNEKDLVIPPGFSFPTESIHPQEFLSLSGDKRADFVMASMGDINTIAPGELEAKFDFFQESMPFSELTSKLKDKKSETEKEVKRCIANIQKLTGEASVLPSGNLKEWEGNKTKANAEREKIVAEISANAERVRLAGQRQQQIDRLKKNIGDADAKIKGIEAKIAQLSGSIVVVQEHRPIEALNIDINGATSRISTNTALKKDLEGRLAALKAQGCCPFCKSPVDSLEDQIDEWDMTAFNLQTEIDADTAKLSALSKAKEVAEANRYAEREISIEKDALKRYKEFKATAEDDLADILNGETSAPVSVEILQGKADGLRLQIEEAEAAIKAFLQSQAVRNQKSKSEEERNQLETDLEKITEGIAAVKAIRNNRMAEVQDKLRQPFQTVINKAFGRDSFLRLNHNDKPCFEFGFIKDKQEVGFDTMSGGERAVVLPALVACIQIARCDFPGIGLFELAEADDLSSAALIAATQAIGFEQVVVASCHSGFISNAVNIDMSSVEGNK